MSTCSIDHSKEDVRKKLESQKEYLPQELALSINEFLKLDHKQTVLNDLFHLLKKYDLSSTDERRHRDQKMSALLQQIS